MGSATATGKVLWADAGASAASHTNERSGSTDFNSFLKVDSCSFKLFSNSPDLSASTTTVANASLGIAFLKPIERFYQFKKDGFVK